MTQIEAALKEFNLVLERKDLEEIFSRLGAERDWHRLAERVSQLNKLCRPMGVDLILRRDKRDLRVCFASLEGLHSAIRALAERRGYIQKSFAAALQSKSAFVIDRRCVPPKLLETQRTLLKEMLARDLGAFGRLDIDSVLVEVPAAGQAKGATLFSAAAAALPGCLLVTGEGGSGKTTLLYMLLSRWNSLGRKLGSRTPIYLPAKHLHFDWGRPCATWEAIPGVDAHMAERLAEAFEDGRLVLLIDGINENPACTDFANPAVQAFWRTAAKNSCVITLLPGYYHTNLRISPLETIFRGKLKRLEVPAWGTAQYRALFENLAIAAGGSRSSSLPGMAGYLNKLSVEEWQKSSSLIRFTPLTGLACANFFASNQAMRLPKNEYELMEHMTSFHLRHESIKGTSSFSHDTALGLLTKLAWRAYTEGNGGQSYTLPFETVARIMKEHYPHLEEHGSEILSTLGHLPYLEYSPANSAVFMNQHFTDYLVARKVLQTFLAGDSKSLREVMSIPWQYMHMSRYYFQGIRCLDAAQKQRFLHVSRATFQAVWQEYLKDRSFLQAVALAYILQPLGFLDMDEARDFLRQVYTQAEDKGEFVLMSCAIGSAWGEDHGGLEKYVQRMRADGEAAKFNLNVYLFFRRQDRLRLDIENFKPELIGEWSATADWLLECMLRKDWDFYPLRLLYAFTVCNFLKTMGSGPFELPVGTNFGVGDANRRRGQLAQVMSAWEDDSLMRTSPLMRRQVDDLRSLVKKLKLNGGEAHDAKEKVVRKVGQEVPA